MERLNKFYRANLQLAKDPGVVGIDMVVVVQAFRPTPTLLPEMLRAKVSEKVKNSPWKGYTVVVKAITETTKNDVNHYIEKESGFYPKEFSGLYRFGLIKGEGPIKPKEDDNSETS